MVIKRTLPRRLAIWKKKRNERLLKRKQNRDKIMAEWVKYRFKVTIVPTVL